MESAREAALNIISDVLKPRGFQSFDPNKELNIDVDDERDRRLALEIAYGVIERKNTLDYILEQYLSRAIDEVDIVVINILRMGLYQIIYLDRIPPSAAVNESVNLAKKYSNAGAARMVNAVLRNFLRNGRFYKLPPKDDRVKYLSIVYSHPEWVVKRWLDEFGYEFTIDLLEADNKRLPIAIRANTLKMEPKFLINKLKNEGIEAERGNYLDEAIIIKKFNRLENLQSYKEGLFYIQDEASMLVSHVLNPREGEFIVDVCSAPGGKTTHIAELMKNKGHIIARDVHKHKLKIVNENAERLGIKIIETQLYDATTVDENLIEKADRVLVDAPCSGLGTIRHRPDIRWNKHISDIHKISALQKIILRNASQYVKKGGILVYSTCTIEKEENIDVINDFLEKNSDFRLIDFNDLLPSNLMLRDSGTGYITLYPSLNQTDGFFIAKMSRLG
ncbi:16S rRNA (cytosine(967)-C(5))-methyltransferase RsmB [Calorimonas adulescens]|uniref:16S rRNA (cytosine(967)-C(5))-methyltransferase n=1 Tax=Calorimonas adulescens TaxID=2606906 RepID=A0A5D8QFE4_9THEO|nr:16S rRNA (cytosine(967)-C(5))-methyltransferase RsmB [Calorimonas adulescens]TZE83410.1 16S rRNA (cytosine(967)-C(5))-methyltransferase RsmB [Calorimonas adulescens]